MPPLTLGQAVAAKVRLIGWVQRVFDIHPPSELSRMLTGPWASPLGFSSW